MFADRETGAYYGCEGTQLYINSPILWNYIKNTVDKMLKSGIKRKELPADSSLRFCDVQN